MSRGNQKEPIELILAKGNKHLSKAEIENRKNSEIKVKFTDVKPPDYLTEKQQKDFFKISKILLDIGIMSELDEDCLAHYLISNENYIQYTKKLRELNKELLKAKRKDKIEKIESNIDDNLIRQDRALKQCRACANDLGLSITSRCKLVMPPSKDSPKENKFNKFKVIGN